VAQYSVGDLVNCRATFTEGGVDVDPMTIEMHVRVPDGTVDIYTHAGGTVTRTAVGVYESEFEVTQFGVYHYKWVSTGPGQAAAEMGFQTFYTSF